ncbi:MAG: DUF2442 domain-containing protein [Proteobacteria bacterium]|nr:DUF2442 domain-containing protein [Pseudomonadota bacterium]
MRIRKAEYLEGHKIRLLFNDNKTKIVDLEKELLGPLYEPLKDVEYFKQVSVDEDFITIQWPNGADFSPNFLYKIGKEVG